jgi:2-oxoisovalerate dehydrogenase E1 component alpha subunit
MKAFQNLSKRIARPFSGNYTSNLQSNPEIGQIPVFRLIDNSGGLLDKSLKFDDDEIGTYRRILQKMVEMEVIDDILNKSQRQGRISFYMTSTGETGAILGSVAALSPEDMLMTQYREMSALYWRGYTLKEITDNCVSNVKDQNKSRQMPIHFSCSRLNFFSISSPLGTQLPQAAGYGYGLRTKNEKKIVATYFGEGSASEGDFYAAINFAQTLKSQTLFFCRNNFYAISTPVSEQTSGDNILPKALSFGMKAQRVDGNDPVAVYRLVKHLREYITTEQKPAFVEAMTYRVGNHSTSDDSSYYRKNEEIEHWRKNNNPITRLTGFLEQQGAIDKTFIADLENIKDKIRKEVSDCLRDSLNEQYPSINSLFEDVYAEMPKHLRSQRDELNAHIARHRKQYEAEFDLLKYAEK